MAKNKDEQEFLSVAHERFSEIDTNDKHNRLCALKSLRFVYDIDNGQWADSIRTERENDGRPCLTSNKLRKFVAQVANRERDQKITTGVRPVDDKGDVRVANVISGILRQIGYASNTDKIYVEAGEHALAGSFAYWRITSEELPESFEQELFVRQIENQFSVYLDPRRRWGFIKEKISAEDFKKKYPKAEVEDFVSNQLGEYYRDWYDTDSIYIAEYFYKEKVNVEIVQVFNELTGDRKVIKLTDKITREKLQNKGFVIEREKKVDANSVKWAKITGSQILEEGEWAGEEIPIVELEGDWVTIDGKTYKRSLVADAIDDQRMYNYWKTTMTETVALAPKAPWLVTTTMIKGLASFWDVAHKKLQPYLPYKPHGNARPTREAPPQVPTGAGAMLELCQRDIQDTIGMYDSSFGERSNERTGVAIRQRAQRSDFGTLHFTDNFRRAILETSKMLIDLIPKIYDTQRTIRIIGDDAEEPGQSDTFVSINEELEDGTILNDLTMGKYDVVADTKMMSTRRQEMLDGMAATIQASPNIAPILIGDLAKAQDWPGADRIAAKIEKFLNQTGGESGPNTQSGGNGQPESASQGRGVL